ncbi:MAG: transporter [Candidatus Acidiferrales bacterium]
MSISPSRISPGLLLAGVLLLSAHPGHAQDRPLQTPDAEVVPQGTVRVETGFDFLQDVSYPLSGLSGDLTNVADIDVRLGVGSTVEVELSGVAQQFLDVKQQGASFVPTLALTGPDSTHDNGDFSFSSKLRLFGEGHRHPALAMEFGFIMPNSDQTRGIGNNATDIFSEFIWQRAFRQLDTFGNLGVEIMTSPNALYSQNDELLYGVAFRYPLGAHIHLVGEVNGRYTPRKIIPALYGTESRGQARLGLQVSAGGFMWDVAGIKGVNHYDPSYGWTFGVSRDISLFPAKKSTGQ